MYLADIKISMSRLPQNYGILGKVHISQSFRAVAALHDRVESESGNLDNLGHFLMGQAKPGPIMLLLLPIIPSRISQKFYPLFFIYSHAIIYYSYIILNI